MTLIHFTVCKNFFLLYNSDREKNRQKFNLIKELPHFNATKTKWLVGIYGLKMWGEIKTGKETLLGKILINNRSKYRSFIIG